MGERRVDVLLVEDNPGDARLFHEVLTESRAAASIHHVSDGAEAMSFLRREGRYSEAPIPGLLILDLNLPRKDGRTVLAEMRNSEGLAHIPVVVFTTSSAESDIAACYELGASAFVVKPIDLDSFYETVSGIETFWLKTVVLPGDSPVEGAI